MNAKVQLLLLRTVSGVLITIGGGGFMMGAIGAGAAGQGDILYAQTDPNSTRVEAARYVSGADILLGRIAPFLLGTGLTSILIGGVLLCIKPIEDEDPGEEGYVGMGMSLNTQIQDPLTLLQPEVVRPAPTPPAPSRPIAPIPSVGVAQVTEAEMRALYGGMPSMDNVRSAIRLTKPEPESSDAVPAPPAQPQYVPCEVDEEDEVEEWDEEGENELFDVSDLGAEFEVGSPDTPLYSEKETISDLLVNSIKNQTHVIVAAKTQSGKSTLFQSAVHKAIDAFGGPDQYGKNIIFAIADPKGNTWCGLEYKRDILVPSFNKKVKLDLLPELCRSSVLRVVEDHDMQYVIDRLRAVKNLLTTRIQVRQKIAVLRAQYSTYGDKETLQEIERLSSSPTMKFTCVVILDEHRSLSQKAKAADLAAKAGRQMPPTYSDWGSMESAYKELSDYIARTGAQDRILIWRVVHSLRVGGNFDSGEEKEQCLELALGRKGRTQTLEYMINQVAKSDQNVAKQLRQSLYQRLALDKHESVPLAIAPVGHSPGESYGLWTAEDLSQYYNPELRGIQISVFPPARPR